MYDKSPVLDPKETIPLLQDQFYYPPYITLAHMYKPPTGWFMIPQQISQYQLLYGVDGKADNIMNGVKCPLGKGIFTSFAPVLFDHCNHLNRIHM